MNDLWYVRTQPDLDKLVCHLEKSKRIAFDIETQGRDALVDKILLLAFTWLDSAGYRTAVVRRFGLDLGGLGKVLHSEHALKLIHHAKFEWKMLYGQEGIDIRRMFCSFLAEKLINDGRVDGFGLDDLLLRRKGIEMPKDLQKSFIGMPADSEFTDQQVAYAAGDTVHLPDIVEQQSNELREFGQKVIDLAKTEFALVPVLARMELEGLTVDEARWRQHLIALKARQDPLEPEVKAALTPILRDRYNKVFILRQAYYASRVKEMAQAELAAYWQGPIQNKPKKDKAAFEAQWLPAINGTNKVEDIGLLPRSVMNAIHRTLTAEAEAATEQQNKRRKNGQVVKVKSLQDEVKALWARLQALDDDGINLASQQQVVEAYRLCDINVGLDGMEPHQIEWDERGLPKYSIDADALQGALHEMGNNPRYAVLAEATRKFLEYKKLEKQRSTYGAGMLDLRHTLTGRIHTDYQQIGSKGGRLSAREPNVMNIPNRGEQTIYRTFFIAPPKHALIKIDFSQIELRIAAEITDDPALVEAYRTGQDVHSKTASLVTGIPYDEIVARKESDQFIKDQRSGAKIVNFGIGYGMTKYGLSTNTGWPLDKAEAFIRRHKEVYAVMDQRLDEIGNLGLNRGYAETLAGRRLYFGIPAENDPDRGRKCRSIYRRARNMPIQGTSADITKTALVRIARELEPFCTRPVGRRLLQAPSADAFTAEQVLPEGVIAYPANTVHDELVFFAPRDRADEVAEIASRAMVESGRIWVKKVPVEVDVHIGATWGG